MDGYTITPLGYAVFTALYLLPAIIAAARKHHHGWSILFLTVLLGWTVLGWIVALIWSGSAVKRPESD